MAEQKRLTRTDGKIAGVCAGLGKYFDIDPVIFRAIFLFLAIVYGGGLLLYLIMVIITPKEKTV
jgi:phage shock protein PspC (stress-responsive transcriptional regulator)